MPEPSAYILSRSLTQLVGRKVGFVPTKLALDKTKQVYGIYDLLPHGLAVVVKCDLILLGSFAGALVGFPQQAVLEHLKNEPIDEVLRDAMSEVLNVAAAAITLEGRAVFKRIVPDPSYIDGIAGKIYKEPFRRNYFTVQIEGYEGGRLAIFSPYVPIKLTGARN